MNKTDGTENRRLILFSELGIPHLLSLGRVELSAHTQMCLLPHIHPDQFEICFHYDGQQEYVVEEIPYLTQSGDLFITYPNEEHSSGSSGEEKSKLFYFIFELTPGTQRFMGFPRSCPITSATPSFPLPFGICAGTVQSARPCSRFLIYMTSHTHSASSGFVPPSSNFYIW